MVFHTILDPFFKSLFGWAIDINPLFGLIVITFSLTLLVTLVYKFMTDQEMMKRVKEEMKEIRKEIKLAAQDPVKMAELNKISIQKSMAQMKHTMKPTLITMVPLLLIISWIRNVYDLPENAINFFGISSWLWTYIILSIIISIVLRKVLKVH